MQTYRSLVVGSLKVLGSIYEYEETFTVSSSDPDVVREIDALIRTGQIIRVYG